MTVYELRQYRGLKFETEAIRFQIEQAYSTVRSPQPKEVIAGKSSAHMPGSPTEQAFERVQKLKEKLCKCEEKIQEIENWVDALSDGYIASVVRYHYLEGMTWDVTAFKIYGYYAGDTVRKAVQRYFDTYKV